MEEVPSDLYLRPSLVEEHHLELKGVIWFGEGQILQVVPLDDSAPLQVLLDLVGAATHSHEDGGDLGGGLPKLLLQHLALQLQGDQLLVLQDHLLRLVGFPHVVRLAFRVLFVCVDYFD
jgi:hypothetical protein